MTLRIVIINYRTPALTIDCLRSIEPEAATVSGLRAVVVDNASGDGSGREIARAIEREGWSAWAEVILSPVNGGFSAGNNIGIRSGDAEFYLLLNSDTVVRPGSIAAMVEHMKAGREIGVLGPRLEWPDGEPQVSCFRAPTPLTEFVYGAATGVVTRLLSRHEVAIGVPEREIDAEWVSFACVMLRREVIERIGPMDEGYFMYFEDIDYCRRAAAAGWKVRHDPAARVVHLRGGSSPVKARAKARKRLPRYFYESRARYYSTYYGRSGLWAANALWTLGRGVYLARQVLTGRPPVHVERQLLDNWINWLNPRAPAGAPGRPPARGRSAGVAA